jgi:hypothetical protein
MRVCLRKLPWCDDNTPHRDLMAGQHPTNDLKNLVTCDGVIVFEGKIALFIAMAK